MKMQPHHIFPIGITILVLTLHHLKNETLNQILDSFFDLWDMKLLGLFSAKAILVKRTVVVLLNL